MKKDEILFRSSKKRGSRARTANIFFHGYSAGHTEKDRQSLFNSMPASCKNTVNIFGYWNSNHYLNFSKFSTNGVFTAARANLYLGAIVLACDRIHHFRRSRLNAENIGKIMPYLLLSYLNKRYPDVTTVNLVGHSLGGRLVLSALKNWPLANRNIIEINNVLILGGAIELLPFEARKISSVVNGQVINAYSKSDKVLFLNIGEDSIGRKPVKYFRNINFKGFGHTDYWPLFSKVSKTTKFDLHRSRVRIYR